MPWMRLHCRRVFQQQSKPRKNQLSTLELAQSFVHRRRSTHHRAFRAIRPSLLTNMRRKNTLNASDARIFTKHVRFDSSQSPTSDETSSIPKSNSDPDPREVRAKMTFTVPNGYDFHSPSYVNYDAATSVTSAIHADSPFDRYIQAKQNLDYGYHCRYDAERETGVHNVILDAYAAQKVQPLRSSLTGESCESSGPWFVCTAGPMGAGKTYTLRYLHSIQRGLFPLDSFVHVSPDRIKKLLPEYDWYLSNGSFAMSQAGSMLRREAGYLCECICNELLWPDEIPGSPRNVWLDTSLREKEFFEDFFAKVRRRDDADAKSDSRKYPSAHRIALIHVRCANERRIFERVLKRARQTRRLVPEKDIRDSIRRTDTAVQSLKHLADVCIEIDNTEDVVISPEENGDGNEQLKSGMLDSVISTLSGGTIPRIENGPQLVSIEYRMNDSGSKRVKRYGPSWSEFRELWCAKDLQTHFDRHSGHQLSQPVEYIDDDEDSSGSGPSSSKL